jgi:hypothetical protein
MRRHDKRVLDDERRRILDLATAQWTASPRVRRLTLLVGA